MNARAFAGTTVSLDKSMSQVKKLLIDHGIRESRYTQLDPDERFGEGRLIYEFVAGEDALRRGVRIEVRWREARLKKDSTTASMAGRALFWFLKSKFDSIDYGIEEFDVAFMPHLLTAIGSTFAEQPHLIAQAVQQSERLSLVMEQPEYQLLESGR